METLLFLLIVLGCPLMMLLMMRGHGYGGHSSGTEPSASAAELRRLRDELDRQIAEREREELVR